MKKKHYLVFDCETAGSPGYPEIYDFGYVICNRKGEIVTSFSSLVAEIFYDTRKMENAFYGSKRPMYCDWADNGFIQINSWAFCIAQLNRDLIEWNVDEFLAYNLEFDRRALKTTNALLGDGSKILEQPVELQDIWGMACELIANKPMYQATAKAQGWVTEKGNIKTGAEFLYRYITKEYNFEESHTAYDDAVIESRILAHCLKQGKKFSKGILPQPWRLAQL
jgi:hypothetical protein